MFTPSDVRECSCHALGWTHVDFVLEKRTDSLVQDWGFVDHIRVPSIDITSVCGTVWFWSMADQSVESVTPESAYSKRAVEKWVLTVRNAYSHKEDFPVAVIGQTSDG